MFNNECFSDIKFVVRKMDGESESKYVIPAHKFVLSISSPAFEAMFYGELAETIEEVELFKAVDSWATKKCKEEGLTADGSVKRKIIGENIVKAIRFPAMKQQDFAGVVLGTKILTQDEVCDVVKYLNSVLSSPVRFPVNRRLCTFACKQNCLIFTQRK